MSRSARSSLAVLLLVLLLVPAATVAADSQRVAEAHQSSSSVTSAWRQLVRVWSLLTGADLDNGCSPDPNGSSLATLTITLENGCVVDPDGRCMAPSPTITLDNGCEVDPSGRCHS
jgi:hypothetical protein